MSALVAEGADVDPWRFVPNGDDTAVLPVPGLFVQVAGCAGYAATRSEDLVDQIRIMIDAIGAEGAPADHPSGDGPLVCNRAEHSRRHRDVRVEAHFNRSRKRGHVCARRHLTPAAFRQRDAAHGQPRDPRNRKNPGRVAVCHGCPLHPGFCGCPYAYACGAGASYSATQEVRIRRIGRRPRSDEGLDPMTTSLAAALSALELGHLEPRAEDVSGMCPPSTDALEQTTTAIWSDLFATLQNTSLERDIEEMGWGLVNLFHRAAAKKHATIDRLTDEIRLLLAEQDGSEINTANLEDKIDLAKKIEEAATCYEHMRDTAAAHYIRETGRSWIPSTGNRISLGVTSAIVDGRAFLQARRERVRDANTAQGTPVVFAGGRLTFRTDEDMKAFGDNLLRTLGAVRERVGDMYLVHGGDMKGIERIAASWAEQNGIQQVRFGLDRKLGDRAGFRRNEQMLSLKPRYVIAFQGNGVTERLVIDAKKAGIRVVDRRGPLGTPPAAQNAQRDRRDA